MTIRPILRLPTSISDPDNTIPIADYNAGVAGLSGLMSWHTAHPDFLTKDGSDRVSALLDRSGHSRTFAQATGGNQPLYEAAQINGQGVITFTPARFDRMTWGGTFPTGGSGDHTKVVVMKGVGAVTGTAQNILFGGSGIADGKHLLVRSLSGTGVATNAVDSSPDQVAPAMPFLNDTWGMLIGSFKSGVGRASVSINGAVTQASDVDAAVAVSTLQLGNSAGGLAAQIADIMIFNIDLHDPANSAALSIVKGYVLSTYGIASS